MARSIVGHDVPGCDEATATRRLDYQGAAIPPPSDPTKTRERLALVLAGVIDLPARRIDDVWSRRR